MKELTLNLPRIPVLLFVATVLISGLPTTSYALEAQPAKTSKLTGYELTLTRENRLVIGEKSTISVLMRKTMPFTFKLAHTSRYAKSVSMAKLSGVRRNQPLEDSMSMPMAFFIPSTQLVTRSVVFRPMVRYWAKQPYS
jgi:hypothetical protein